MLLPGAFFLFALALIILWQSSRQQRAAGLPGGRVIYTDTSEWGAVEKPLYDPVIGLTGRPDYLVKKGKQIIPVEVKTSRTPDAPYDSHIYQLAAYCMLVARGMKRRPPYGILHYPKRSFAIDYTEEMETSLLDLLAEIRNLERKDEAYRSHEELNRCNGCGFRNDCDQRL